MKSLYLNSQRYSNSQSTPNSQTKQPDVLVVGSGITGLMTAYSLINAGYSVRVLSKSPDPRSATPGTCFESSTWDGYVNRYITLTEGHPYLDLMGYISVMYPEIGTDFQSDITQGGMLALPFDQWGPLTRQFLQERMNANANQEATFKLFRDYIDENRASMEMWYELLTKILLQYPHLSPVLSLHSHGIDRFYDAETLYEGAATAQQAQAIVKQCYSICDLLQQPDFKLYWQGLERHSFIRGGGLTMYGLAFDVQALGREWLLQELEKQGSELWFGAEYEVVKIEKNDAGLVTGLMTQDGTLHTAKYICFHSGAYSQPHVFADTPAYGKLAGVKGLWMRIKNAQRLFGDTPPRPNKIHGGKYEIQVNGQTYRGQVADLNVMPKQCADGSWELVIGSGYLFVGTYPFEADRNLGIPHAQADRESYRQAQIQLAEELAIRAFVQVVSQVYQLEIDLASVLAGTHPSIDLPAKGCVRSWTPDDQELRVILPTIDGGILLIDGGGNTGSTTKAPFISRSILLLMQSLNATMTDPRSISAAELAEFYETVRHSLRKTQEQMPSDRWQDLENMLNQALENAEDLNRPTVKTQPKYSVVQG